MTGLLRPPWRCIPCGASNFDQSPYCTNCGRRREDATDAARWQRFFGLDAVIVAAEDEEPCPHEHVEKDDDGRDYWFYICLDCDKAVYLTEPDEDGKSYWEVVE